MKKKLAATIIFVVILVFPMVFWPLLNLADNTQIDENRALASYPDTFDNEYFSNFDKYFLDHLPLRNVSISVYNSAKLMFNTSYDKLLTALNLEHYIEQNGVVFGEGDWLFYSNDNSLDFYRGTNLPSPDKLQQYVERATLISEYFKSQGKDFVVMVSPNKEQIYSEHMPNGIKVQSQVKRLDMINEYFAENSDVKFLYPKQALLDAKQSYQVYYKQDTHWSRAGAYIGAMELLDLINVPRGDVSMTAFDSYKADLAKMLLQAPIKDIDYICDYRAEVNLDVDFDDEVFSCKTDNPNGRKLFLIGDSFRENMVEVISKEFCESTLIHRSKFNEDYNYFERQISEADVVVFQVVERYESKLFGDNGIMEKFISLYNLR